MVWPSSQVSKILLGLLFFVILWYLFMDINLYLRIQNYPLENELTTNYTKSYQDVSWVSCNISPICDVTPKALLLDHTNHYIFAPLAQIIDDIFKISKISWITPNSISFFHVFVAIVSAKCISDDSLAYRRIGVVLFEFRTFLDDMDGHVARARKNIKGELSEVGTTGYYVDGICDGLGIIALFIGMFIYLRNNPPRRGYMQLPTIASENDRDNGLPYRIKVTTKKVVVKICFFSAQVVLSSAAWNRYIALYQDMLGNHFGMNDRQLMVFRSPFFFSLAWMWRIINLHNLLHLLLLSIFCDKLWEFLRFIQYIGFVMLLGGICITEIHILDVKNFLYKNLGNGATY